LNDAAAKTLCCIRGPAIFCSYRINNGHHRTLVRRG
jgi:hypothetical protein